MKNLLVILVVAILAISAYKVVSEYLLGKGGYFRSRTNMLDKARRADIGEIAKALTTYSSRHSSEYPANLDLLVTMGFLETVPSDIGGSGYFYRVSSDRRSASVYTVLETRDVFCWRSGGNEVKVVSTPVFCQP